MFTVALGIKVPVFPFHLWLPEVHSETDTCGSVLLAGVLLKVGSYGLMRFTLTLFPVGYSYRKGVEPSSRLGTTLTNDVALR